MWNDGDTNCRRGFGEESAEVGNGKVGGGKEMNETGVRRRRRSDTENRKGGRL